MNERLTDCYGRDATVIGYDADGNSYVLRWSEPHGCWIGVGFRSPIADAPPMPTCFVLKGDMADFIVDHSRPAEQPRAAA